MEYSKSSFHADVKIPTTILPLEMTKWLRVETKCKMCDIGEEAAVAALVLINKCN